MLILEQGSDETAEPILTRSIPKRVFLRGLKQ